MNLYCVGRMKIFVAFLFCLGSICCNPVWAQLSKSKFVVVQSMHYKGGVDVSEFGVVRNPIIYESSLLPSKASDQLVRGADFDALVAGLEKGPLPTVIDIERWSIYTESEIDRTKNKEKFLEVLKRIHGARPEILLGFYGVIPERTYWPIVDKNKIEERKKWARLNDKAVSDFAQYVDAIYPSLYTFYEDQAGWRIYAEETLKAARKFGKPVYCYLWPQYHSSNLKLHGEYLPVAYWQMELETCYQHSDGIVIWNYEPDAPWNPHAPWWQQTLKFLNAHGLNK